MNIFKIIYNFKNKIKNKWKGKIKKKRKNGKDKKKKKNIFQIWSAKPKEETENINFSKSEHF